MGNYIETKTMNNVLIEQKLATFQGHIKQTKGLSLCLSIIKQKLNKQKNTNTDNNRQQPRRRRLSAKAQKQILDSRLKSSVLVNSYIDRMNHLIARNKISTPNNDESLNITVILLDEETCHNESLSFEFNSTDKITVDNIIQMIPLYAKDSALGKQSYQSLCLENSLILEKFEPLQCYFLPSDESQFLIAIPATSTTNQIVKLAQPIIQEVRSIPVIPVNRMKKMEKKNRDSKMSPPPLLQKDSIKSLDVEDSYCTTAPNTTICIADVIYVIMIMIFFLCYMLVIKL